MPKSISEQPNFFQEKPNNGWSSSPYYILVKSLNTIVKQDGERISMLEGHKIVNTVMETVNRAVSGIKMTMDLAEEIKKPLPEAYHQLLLTKLDEGVQIIRVGFGKKRDFQKITQSHGFNSPNFKFVYNANYKEYQRMILIDDNILFFRHNDIFYKTANASVIGQFQNYFSGIS